MRKIHFLLAGFLAAVAGNGFAGTPEFTVEKLPDLVVAGTQPAQGVAGAFSGFIDGKIVIAGGCNFPEKGPADGGKKVFYDTIWTLALDDPSAAWQVSPEKLSSPAAYGAGGELFWVGGENAEKKTGEVFGVGGVPVNARSGRPAPAPLPVAVDNAASVFGGIVAGGNVNGVPANKAFIFRRAGKNFPQDGAWESLQDFPGTPRVQPVGGLVLTPRGVAFAVVGGFYFDKESGAATVDRAGVIYYPEKREWATIAPLPPEISEAGLVGAAAVEYDGGLLIVGGVNAKIFKDALEKPTADYLRHDAAWYKFNADVLFLSFDADGNAVWKKFGVVPALARAGASLVPVSEDEFVYICGESKPGVRSTKCVRVKISVPRK